MVHQTRQKKIFFLLVFSDNRQQAANYQRRYRQQRHKQTTNRIKLIINNLKRKQKLSSPIANRLFEESVSFVAVATKCPISVSRCRVFRTAATRYSGYSVVGIHCQGSDIYEPNSERINERNRCNTLLCKSENILENYEPEHTQVSSIYLYRKQNRRLPFRYETVTTRYCVSLCFR
jgi:predicted Zn-ribbon and HTH transcriptional regulator